MNEPDPLEALLRRRLKALVRDLPSAREGNAGALHRTRVASRRMRAALPFLEVSFKPLKMGRVRRKTRGLTKALGQVRELDVALGILEEFSNETKARQRVVARVGASVEKRRSEFRRAMLRRLEHLAPERLVGDLAEKLDRRTESGADETWRERLSVQLGRRAHKVREAIGEAGVLFVPVRLHQVRIALKKLRYALELANETGVTRSPRTLKTLKRGQDLLGRLHDLDVLSDLVTAVRDDAPAGATTRELDALLLELAADARQLHGRYVATRGRIDMICRAMDGLSRRLRAAERNDGDDVTASTRQAS